MKDYYSTLGVEKTATDDDIKKAYRKLASKHHPDKVTGDADKAAAEVKFKEIKEAFEAIETAEKRERHNHGDGFQQFTQMDDLLHAFRAAHARAQQNTVPFVRLNLSIEKAFNGTTLSLNLFGHSIAYVVRPGLPPGVAYADEVPVEDRKRQVQIQINIDGGRFRFRQLGSEDGMNFCGDLETDIEVDALDILNGEYVVIADFLGKQLQVRIPSGFDTRLRLKVASHGYTNWRGDAAGPRGDLFLRVNPTFKSIKDVDPKKVEALNNATRQTA